jgi:uncharacterized protein (DUF2141 family)
VNDVWSTTLLLAIAAVALGGEQEKPPTSEVTVTVSGLRNDRGDVLLSLFRSKDGFPEDASKAFRTFQVSSSTKGVKAAWPKIPYGTYAVAALHDENRNRKLDKGWFGIPKEGTGASNNPNPKRRAPRFDEAKVTVDREKVRLRIVIRYH